VSVKQLSWTTASAIHRRRHYDTYRLGKGLEDIVREIGNDPALHAEISHLRALMVTAHHRHIFTLCPAVIKHRTWSKHGTYLTEIEMEMLRASGGETQDA